MVQVCLYSAALLVPVYYDLALVVSSPRNIALAIGPLLCSGLLTYWYYDSMHVQCLHNVDRWLVVNSRFLSMMELDNKVTSLEDRVVGVKY